MSAFTIDMSGPFQPGFGATDLGGPNVGGHQPPNWYEQFGMDFGAPEGTPVRAAFDAHITRHNPHDPATDTPKVYGAQLFMRARNNMMGGYYTHITGVPAGLTLGATVSRGDPLGTVCRSGGTTTHLHWALVEIIGGAPDGQYRGVDLNQFFLGITGTDAVTSVTFFQDGSPPAPGADAGPKVYNLASLRGIQEALAVLGYEPGTVDGMDGPHTQAAVRAFQRDQGLPEDGQCAGDTLVALSATLQAKGFLVDGA
ncbi:peptidoglycan-binding protein [Streptomyces sp. NPDC006458]|uniref:peptidoglycan-binding protein n=1 Tax=Streptomyces sp. NPDC006458 TaxID=3154302 RepID=UPI0033A63332